MHLRTRVLAFVCWLSLCPDGTQLDAAEPVALKQLPELGINEILAEIDRRDAKAVDDLRSDEIAARAAQLILSSDLASHGEYATMLRLAEAAQPAIANLQAEDKARLEKLLSGMAANGDTAVFEQLQARVSLINAAGKHDEVAVGAIRGWIATRDLTSLDLNQLVWLLSEIPPQRSGVNQFAASWTGTITAPRSGKYEFSTTRIDVNRGGVDPVRQTIVAKIDEVEVLRTPRIQSSADGNEVAQAERWPPAQQWEPNGASVDLIGNHRVPILVEISYESSRPDATAMPSAILCWKGPGISHQPIAAESFTSGEGASNGLDAEYKWHENGEAKLAHEKAAAIDFVWSSAGEIASADSQLMQRISDRLWSLATADDYIAKCEEGEATHAYIQDPSLARHLSSTQRREFQELLTSRPHLLQRITHLQISPVYRNFRFGAEDAAINLLGAWMHQYANVQPEIVADFFERNRRVYAEIGQMLAMQQPGGIDRLRNDFLVNEHGHCVLPVAYTNSYANHFIDRVTPLSIEDMESSGGGRKTKLTEWTDLLTTMSSDESSGDAVRINWLLARAQSMEVATTGPENYLAGIEWVREALHMPGDENELARVNREEIARLVAMNRTAQVSKQFEHLATAVPALQLREWKSQADIAQSVFMKRKQESSRLTKNAYRDALARRRDQAATRNDDAAVAKYDAKLRVIGENPQ